MLVNNDLLLNPAFMGIITATMRNDVMTHLSIMLKSPGMH